MVALCKGLADLRARNQHPGIIELGLCRLFNRALNQTLIHLLLLLAANEITDAGLSAIIQYLLLPSAPPQRLQPVLVQLYLSANRILLSSITSTSSLLAAALSHPAASLLDLSLTNNPGLSTSWLDLCSPCSLRHLHLNACELEDAGPLASFVVDPARSERLHFLELNGNYLNDFDTKRLARIVIDGRNTSLQILELSANAGERPLNTAAYSESDEDEGDSRPDRLSWSKALNEALQDNKQLQRAVQRTALQLLPIARILVHAKEPVLSARVIRDQVEAISDSSSLAAPVRCLSISQSPTPQITPFPFLRLPSELQTQIMRSLTRLMAISFRSRIPQSLSSSGRNHAFVYPLTETQFLNVIAYASRRPFAPHSLIDRSEAGQVAMRTEVLEEMSCNRWSA